MRIEREKSLHTLKNVHRCESHGVEEKHGGSIRLPVHLLVRLDARKSVDQPFHRTQEGIKRRSLTLEYPYHVCAERPDGQQNCGHVSHDLQYVDGRHSKSSGFKRAAKR